MNIGSSSCCSSKYVRPQKKLRKHGQVLSSSPPSTPASRASALPDSAQKPRQPKHHKHQLQSKAIDPNRNKPPANLCQHQHQLCQLPCKSLDKPSVMRISSTGCCTRAPDSQNLDRSHHLTSRRTKGHEHQQHQHHCLLRKNPDEPNIISISSTSCCTGTPTSQASSTSAPFLLLRTSALTPAEKAWTGQASLASAPSRPSIMNISQSPES